MRILIASILLFFTIGLAAQPEVTLASIEKCRDDNGTPFDITDDILFDSCFVMTIAGIQNYLSFEEFKAIISSFVSMSSDSLSVIASTNIDGVLAGDDFILSVPVAFRNDSLIFSDSIFVLSQYRQDLGLTVDSITITGGTGLALSDLDIGFQDLSLDGDSLLITNGDGVDLSGYMDNVSTDLSLGAPSADSIQILSSDGTGVTLKLATAVADQVPPNNMAGLMSPEQVDEIIANTAKVSNATHTGEVTGSGALTVDVTAISNRDLVTAAGGDHVMIRDATDGLLKKVDAIDFLSGGSGDDMGDHTATQDLNMSGFDIINIDSIMINFSLYAGGEAARLENYVLNIDQDTSGLDGYVLGLNGASGQIELKVDVDTYMDSVVWIDFDDSLVFYRVQDDTLVVDSVGVKVTGFASVFHVHDAGDITSGTFDDARISESSVTQHQGAIDHDALLNWVAGEHIDWALASQGTIHATNYVDNNTQLSDEQVQDVVGAFVADGTGTYQGISIVYQDGTNDLDITIDHDAALNFVANEHIDHTVVTLTAGAGLSGGGDISASRSFDLDWSGTELTEGTSFDVNDRLAIYDATADGMRYITHTNMISELEADLNHDNLTGFVSNEHIDWTAESAGTIHASNYVDNNTQLSEEQVQDFVGTFLADGTGTYTGISFTYQDGTNDADITIDHDAALNFVANEHIDHTGVTLTAGTGLSGGGDISANRTFNLDLSELTTVDTMTSGDSIVLYNPATGSARLISRNDFLRMPNSWTGQQGQALATLTDAATISWDGNTQQSAQITLGGNRTLDVISNGIPGNNYSLTVIQDGTGTRTLAYNAAYKFPGGTAPTLTTDAGAYDEIQCKCITTTRFHCVWSGAFD